MRWHANGQVTLECKQAPGCPPCVGLKMHLVTHAGLNAMVAAFATSTALFCLYVSHSDRVRRELMAELREAKDKMGAEMKGMKAEMKAEIKEIKVDMKEMKAELKADMKAEKAEMKVDMKEMKAELKAEMKAALR
jgi:hypothetical protein